MLCFTATIINALTYIYIQFIKRTALSFPQRASLMRLGNRLQICKRFRKPGFGHRLSILRQSNG